MKKKIKLLTSIASLGLALALMTFGVLAASQRQIEITSSVSYTTNDVMATVVVQSTQLEVSAANGLAAAPTKLNDFTEAVTDVSKTFTLGGQEGATKTLAFELEDLTTTAYVGYVVKVTNDFTANQDITLTFDKTVTALAEADNNGVVRVVGSKANVADDAAIGTDALSDEAITIEPGKTYTYYVYVSVDPTKASSFTEGNAMDIGSSFTLARA